MRPEHTGRYWLLMTGIKLEGVACRFRKYWYSQLDGHFLDHAGKSASAIGGQRTVWRATGVNIGWSQSFLRRRSISLESTTCISSQHELYRNFQASS